MLKKIVALAMALLMTIPLLAACSAATTPPAAATSAAASSAPAVTTPAASTAEPTATPATSKNLCPYTGDTVTFTAFAADVGIKEDKNSPVYQIYKKAVGNIEINWELAADYDTKIKIYLSSGDIPDILLYNGLDLMQNYSDSGLFLDFNKYKDYTPNWVAATKKNPGLTVYATKLADGTFAQYIMHNTCNDYPVETFFANKTLLDKLGIPLPTNLAEMESAMQKVKEADPTITPFHTYWGISYYEQAFGTCLNARTSMYFDLTDKKWKYCITSPESKYKELIALLADYFQKGYFNPEFATMSSEQTQQLIASSKWAFTYEYAQSIYDNYKLTNNDTLPIDVEPLLPLAAEGVKPNVNCIYVSDEPYWGACISAKCKNPELAVSWLDTLLGDEVSTAAQWGIEGTSYTVDANGKKNWIPEFLAKGDQAATDLGIGNLQASKLMYTMDARSTLQKANPVVKKTVTMLVDAIKSGQIDSYFYRSVPELTAEQNEQVAAVAAPILTKVAEDEALFILGKRPISEWDAFVKEVEGLGDINKVVAIYNDARQSFDRVQGMDRDYVTP